MPSAQAVLGPGAYPSVQRHAPELLKIKVTAVREKKQSEDQELKIMSVGVQARVLAVQRTATGLKAGARITIRYEDRRPKMPGYIGENAVPVLTKGDRCPAYLQRSTQEPAVYEPAAGTYTFERYKYKE